MNAIGNALRRFWPVAALGLGILVTACSSSYPAGPYDVNDPYARPYYPPREVRYGFSVERLAALAHELDDRASRAHFLAERRSPSYGPREQEFFERIHHFSDQARVFHYDLEHGEIRNSADLRSRVARMLDDARETDAALRQANVFPEVWDEWRGAMRALQRMLDLIV